MTLFLIMAFIGISYLLDFVIFFSNDYYCRQDCWIDELPYHIDHYDELLFDVIFDELLMIDVLLPSFLSTFDMIQLVIEAVRLTHHVYFLEFFSAD